MSESYDELVASVRANSHTIDTLIEALMKMRRVGLPGDTVVVIAKDADASGNHFSPLTREEFGVGAGMYAPDSMWSGEHYMTEEYRRGLSDADEYSPAPDDSIPAVFLWPTN